MASKTSKNKTLSVLLTKDIKNFGSAGEIKEATAGYARNYLIPNKLVLIATPKLIADAQAKIQREKDQKAHELKQAKLLADKLSGREIVLRVKAGNRGKIFGSIDKKAILEALYNQHSAKLTEEQVDLPKPLKTLGKHEVSLKLQPEITTTITVQTVSDKK